MYLKLLTTALVALACPSLWAQVESPGEVHAPRTPAAASAEAGTESARPIPGERVDPSTIPPGIVEGMDVVLERERLRPKRPGYVHRARNGAQGTWKVPSRKSTFVAHSGEHYATNGWGDTRMGIGFGAPVDVTGAWIAGQAEEPVWASGLVAVGFRAGQEVSRTRMTAEIGAVPAWFAMDLEQVDRIELRADPVYEGAGFYAVDDLTFERPRTESREEHETVVLTFDDLPWRYELTGSSYGDLTWERGTGSFEQPAVQVEVVHDPKTPPGLDTAEDDEGDGDPAALVLGGGGTLPLVTRQFNGPRFGDTGAGWLPPDTCGAVGRDHFVSVVNQAMSVYDRQTGARLISTSLQSFFNTGGSAGDPRVVYDHFEGRWVVIASNFNTTPSGCFLAYSSGEDATGTWFKAFIPFDGGSDSGNWCDYPTLGIDQNGIYMGAYMVGGNFLMSLFAVDKAPLLAASPSVGTVSAWRQLMWEGALQPCVTHGTPPGEYVVSRRSSTSLRMRRINPPMSAPTLTQMGIISVQFGGNPPSAPAMGSTVPLSTVGTRLMNAVYRNGSVWTAHTISAGGLASSRWYELDPIGIAAIQTGLVQDSVNHYFFPTIAVNSRGDAVLGFTGSSADMFAGAWYTGRLAGDPSGEMAVPVAAKDGIGPYNHASSGSNRWGDYSLTCVDPLDDLALWTIQEYARNNNNWGTWITRLEFPDVCTPQTVNYCSTSPTSTTTGALMAHAGSPNLGLNNFFLEVQNAPSNKFGQFYYGASQVQAPFGDGIRCVGAGGTGTYRLNPLVQTDGIGFATHHLDFSAPPANLGGGQITTDSTWNFQFWFRDPMGPGGTGFNLSDGLSVTFCQ